MYKDNKKNQVDLKPIKKLIAEKVKDGDLSEKDIDDILKETESLYEQAPLSHDDISEIAKTVNDDLQKSYAQKEKVPLLLRILGIVMVVSWVLSLPTIFSVFNHINQVVSCSADLITNTTFTMIVGYAASTFLTIALSIGSGLLMILNKREWAGRFLYASIACTAIHLIFVTSLDGVNKIFLITCVYGIIQILISIYLQPKLYQERQLYRKMKALDAKEREESGRQGIAVDQSKGYIELDFFNLFWIFIIASIIGLLAEYAFHILFVWGFNPENWYDRAGLLFGPFSQIYGFGALFMTIILNRFRNMHPVLLFVFTTLIGGAFEFFVSFFMEVAFGIEAWNYTGMFLSLDGRTCLLFASMFGLMGLVWIKWALPGIMKLIGKIPWKLRYPVTLAFTIFMIVNCVMTIQALDCWSQRMAGKEPVTKIEQFYARNFNDEFMSKRFASMSFQENTSSRDNLENASE